MDSNNPRFSIDKLVTDAESGIFRVGPNASLSAEGLMVEGHAQELRHIEDFKSFVFSSAAVVSTVLAELFPDVGTVIDDAGNAEPSSVSAWEHYSLHNVLLRTGKGDPLKSGRVVLQWCLAAHCVAVITGHECGKSPDFLPIRHLLKEGGRALATSVKDWERYVYWARVGYMQALANGGDTRDPRPAAVSVTIPWPRELGAEMGAPGEGFANACRLASDILVGETSGTLSSFLEVAGHYVRFSESSQVVAEFDRHAPGAGPAALALDFQGVRFRASRMPSKRDGIEMTEYCFRILHTS
ncbi:hypothetical protein [Burkholderia sp. Ac-20365]|uniref:hypothetical protein n=1 Tax=Burkholderia sp. Ac-20365 TaxID=2703897 RepID=UPI00197BE007|nr:hypothetical protein [Burkholderia sp. Ac-20365]MBN3761249.1 hypothetical protein [Burkholderia sp. Ac-20365]